MIISGPDRINRDFHPVPSWRQYSLIFQAPRTDPNRGNFLRLGQWHVRGAVWFDDVELRPVRAIYSNIDGLSLGEGERIRKGE
ncbi:MAG: hypothetical protein KatS3mg115_1068 [Candidatus Poribacteria bacterium]|nr:MAG: hypothetical protein KatS3mg115_1068 [Candidatus Poribacteria bacterium]